MGLIVAIVIVMVLFAIVITNFVLLQEKTDLDSASQEFAGVLGFARSKALASENDSPYGVYINRAVVPHRYTLFKGTSYVGRDSSYDQNYLLSETIEFFAVNLGGVEEINFDRLTGNPKQSGNVSLRHKTDTSQSKTVYISSSGAISFNLPDVPSDASRIKDSRHLHFDYSRPISFDPLATPCSGETINLYFDNAPSPQQQIPICSNLVAGQIEWAGSVEVNGVSQTIRIHSHRLNNPDSQFSIYRDRRLNTKPLTITISLDSSGKMADYSSDGLTTNYSSIYVSNFSWQ